MKVQHKEKKRLILLDLDGTTLRNDGCSIHSKNIEIVKKLSSMGHHICIITGRPHRASIRFYNELNLSTLLTNFDGGHVHDPKRRQFKRIVLPISNEITMSIINNPMVKNSVENVLIEYYDKAMCWKKDVDLENYFHLDDIAGDEYKLHNPYEQWTGPASNIVLVLNNDITKDEVLRSLSSYKDSIRVNLSKIKGEEKTMIILTNLLASKGLSARLLAQYYNVDVRDVIAFGDEVNDVEMMKVVGYSVAMRNGNDDLKTICRGITHLTNDEGGVGDYLEKLLIKHEEV